METNGSFVPAKKRKKTASFPKKGELHIFNEARKLWGLRKLEGAISNMVVNDGNPQKIIISNEKKKR